MAKNCLIYETLNGVKELKTQKTDEGLMTLSGVFGVCGVRNNNQRVYETSNYSKMVTEMQERIKAEGGIPGELEHPQLMNITLENVSHKITDINIDENGVVTGSITLLNTPKGKIAQAIVEGGLPLFISSRATGQVDAKSGSVTLEKIATYDLVGSPGFSQAKLHLNENQVAESINESMVFYIGEKDTEENLVNENNKNDFNENNIDEMELKEILEKIDALEAKIADLEEANEELQSQIDEKENIDLEKLANGIQKWIVEEYSPMVQQWIVEEFASENNEDVIEEAVESAKDMFINEMAPKILNWMSTLLRLKSGLLMSLVLRLKSGLSMNLLLVSRSGSLKSMRRKLKSGLMRIIMKLLSHRLLKLLRKANQRASLQSMKPLPFLKDLNLLNLHIRENQSLLRIN